MQYQWGRSRVQQTEQATQVLNEEWKTAKKLAHIESKWCKMCVCVCFTTDSYTMLYVPLPIMRGDYT